MLATHDEHMIIILLIGSAWSLGLASALALLASWIFGGRVSRLWASFCVVLSCLAYYLLISMAFRSVHGVIEHLLFFTVFTPVQIGMNYGGTSYLLASDIQATLTALAGLAIYLCLNGRSTSTPQPDSDQMELVRNKNRSRHRMFLILAVTGFSTPVIAYLCPWSSQGRLVRGDGFQGIIMDMSPRAGQRRVESWPAAKEDILEFESALRGYITSDTNRFDRIAPELRCYYRQYFPSVQNDQRFINAEFFHTNLIDRFEWLHWTPLISGGGEQNWRIRYYPGTGLFTNFHTNAGM